MPDGDIDDVRVTALAKNVTDRLASGPAEHILNVFKAVLATAPFTGGIASLITDYIPSSRTRRLEEFAQQTAEDLGRLVDRVDEDYLCTDDFAYMFERCFRAAAENPQPDKLEVFRAILVNSAIRRDVAEQEKEYFLNLANNLTVLHIRILKFMADPRRYLRDEGIPESRIQGGFSQFFPVAIPGIPLEMIKSAMNELNQRGLVSADASMFHTMTSSQGLQLLGDRVAPFGRRFIDFCTVPR